MSNLSATGEDRQAMKSPLLVVDGDLFAHRAYHALPKSIRRTGDRGGGAIVGFANFLLRLFEAEQPRAVLVGWDTLGAPTYRQRLFPHYQSGRQFDAELVDQLDVLPRVRRRRAASPMPRLRATRLTISSPRPSASEERRRGTVLVASGDRDAFQLASAATTILHPLKAGEIGPHRSGRGAGALWRRTASGARLHRLARRSFGQTARRPRRGSEGRGHAPAPLWKPGAGDR